MNEWLANLDDWQSHETAPKDGTHIIVSQTNMPLGVFHWEDRDKFLLDTYFGGKQHPAWVGVYFISELEPMTTGGKPAGDRMLAVRGLDEPFMWRPLPATVD